MEPGYLISRLALTDGAAEITLGCAQVLLGSLSVTVLVFASMSMLVRGGAEPINAFMRILFCAAALLVYDDVFAMMVGGAEDLAITIGELAQWRDFWSSWAERLANVLTGSNDSVKDAAQTPAALQNHVSLALTVVSSNYIAFLVEKVVQTATALFLSVLRVFGPLMIVGGLFMGGQTFRHWFNALIQVCLWPTVPPLVMLVTRGVGEGQINDDNTAYLMAQSTIMGLLTIMTPVIVAFMVGKTGLATFAGVAAAGLTTLATSGASKVWGAAKAAGAMHSAGDLAQSLSATVRGGGAGGDSPNHDMPTATAGTAVRGAALPPADPNAITAPRYAGPNAQRFIDTSAKNKPRLVAAVERLDCIDTQQRPQRAAEAPGGEQA